VKFSERLAKPIKLKPETKALFCLVGVGVLAVSGWVVSLGYLWAGLFLSLPGFAFFLIPAMDNDNYQGGG